ncbi:MAG: type IV pilus biogenesis/stability protein PilW [Aquabacterium sp.]
MARTAKPQAGALSRRRMFPGAIRAMWAGLLAAAMLAGCAEPGPATARDRITPSDQTDAERRAKVRIELASAYFSRGQAEVALDEIKQAIAAKPDSAEALSLRGLIYASLGEEALALQSFQQSLKLNPRDPDTLHNYGWYLCQRRQFAEAATQFAAALSTPQYNGAVRTLLAQGVCMARNDEWLPAERALSRAYELDPSNPVVAVNLSEVLMRRGELDRARFYIRRVNSVPELVSAQTVWLATRIEHRLGNAAGVRELGHLLRARFPQSPEALQMERGRFDD